MTTQNQINHCIAYLNEVGEGVSRIEISNDNSIAPRIDSREARVYSLKQPSVYFTIWSIFTDAKIEELEELDYEESIAHGERVAAEVADSIEQEVFERGSY